MSAINKAICCNKGQGTVLQRRIGRITGGWYSNIGFILLTRLFWRTLRPLSEEHWRGPERPRMVETDGLRVGLRMAVRVGKTAPDVFFDDVYMNKEDADYKKVRMLMEGTGTKRGWFYHSDTMLGWDGRVYTHSQLVPHSSASCRQIPACLKRVPGSLCFSLRSCVWLFPPDSFLGYTRFSRYKINGRCQRDQ